MIHWTKTEISFGYQWSSSSFGASLDSFLVFPFLLLCSCFFVTNLTLYASICWFCSVTTTRLICVHPQFFCFIIFWCCCLLFIYFFVLYFLQKKKKICWLAQLYVWCCMPNCCISFVCFCACCYKILEIQNRNGHLTCPRIFKFVTVSLVIIWCVDTVCETFNCPFSFHWLIRLID